MTTRGLVCAVHPNSIVDVELVKAARCKGCEGSCTWFRSPALGKLRLKTVQPFTVGQSVRILLPARYVLIAATLLHGLPWLMLLVGALMGALMGGNDLSCLIGAAFGLVGALYLTPAWHRNLERATDEQFRILPVP